MLHSNPINTKQIKEMPSIKKRFIAGAICPNCEQMDKICVFQVSGRKFAECVSCGFKQAQPDEQLAAKQNTSTSNRKIFWLNPEE